MPYRNLFVESEARLSLKDEQLMIESDRELSFPIEDVRCVVIDNYKTTLSARLISKLAQSGVCVIICDEKHTPCSSLLPLSVYCRMNKRIGAQFSMSVPKTKRIWQSIVTKKICNQALCLKYIGNDKCETLRAISESVLSGDTTNREGYAAAVYFKALFGEEFTRDNENIVNAALNYGYAVLRSYISKTLAAYGFEPSVGVHHKSQLNQFNLADDFIEPYRPVVDLYVAENMQSFQNVLSKEEKGELVRLLNCTVSVEKSRYSLAHSIEMFVQSFAEVLEGSDESRLKIPDLLETEFFDYD